MPAERPKSIKRKAGSAGRLSEAELASRRCAKCGKVLSRASDVPRHEKIHNGAKKLPCPWDGCDFSALQKANLDIHVRRHTGDKSFVCTDDSDPKCKFKTCDPASLLRHRKNLHNYIPRARTCKSSIASTDSSSSRSPSPVDSFLKSFSPVPISPLPNTNSPGSPSRLSPFGESGTTGTTSSSPNTYPLNNSESNNYASAWDTSEFDFLAADLYYIEANNSWLRLVYDDL